MSLIENKIMNEAQSNSVHPNLDIFETVHPRPDSCWRCLNLIWKAVTKRCSFYERKADLCLKICAYQLFGFASTWPKAPSKRIRINFVKLHILFARIYLRSHESNESAHLNHTFLKPLSTMVFFFGFERFATRLDYHDWNRICFILFTQVYTFSPPPPPGFVWTGPESETNIKKRRVHSVPGGT